MKVVMNSVIKYNAILIFLILFNRCTFSVDKQIVGKVWVIEECLYFEESTEDTISLMPYLKINTLVFNLDKSCRHPSWNGENCEWSLLSNRDSIKIISNDDFISGVFKIKLRNRKENNVLEMCLESKSIYLKCVKL
ncbi:MAG: hypothetical protein R2836_08880 [Chitinophagales bacterium]